MTNTKITAETFLDNKELREQTMERVEVLDKVKQLFLIPELECMTVKQVADYFEVPLSTVNDQFQHNRDEFESDGTDFKPLSSFKNLTYGKTVSQKLSNKRGSLTLAFIDGTEITIPNCGVKCFPKRAVLRMGMLLRDSPIAKEVRTQLLNTFEHATEEQRVTNIDEETGLLNGIGAAFATGDMMKFAEACMSLDSYRKRYITKIEWHNTELSKENAKISKRNEEIEENNKSLKTENHILATDILKWTDRASANRVVRVLAGCLHKPFSDTFNLIYHELLYKYSISLKGRAAACKRKNLPLISFIRDDEWIYLYKVIAAICNKTHISLTAIFKKAKIDVSSLDLSE